MHLLYYSFHWCSCLSDEILQCLPNCSCGFGLGAFAGVSRTIYFLFALKEATKFKLFRSSKRQKGKAFVSILIVINASAFNGVSFSACSGLQTALCFKVRASKPIKERTGESPVLHTKSVFYIIRCALPPPEREKNAVLKFKFGKLC